MSTTITAAEVYSASDPNRAVALVSRVGGGRYKVVLADSSPLPKLGEDVTFSAYGEAIAAAEDYAAAFDSGPDGEKAAAAHLAQVQADKLVEQSARIAELEAQIEAAKNTHEGQNAAATSPQ